MVLQGWANKRVQPTCRAASFELGLASENGSVSALCHDGINRYGRHSEKCAKIGAITGLAQSRVGIFLCRQSIPALVAMGTHYLVGTSEESHYGR